MVVKESVKAKFLRINKMSAIKVCLSCVSGVYGRSYSCNGVKKCDGHAAWRDSEICDKPADSFIFFFFCNSPGAEYKDCMLADVWYVWYA